MSELEHLINKFCNTDMTIQVYYELIQDKFNKVFNGEYIEHYHERMFDDSVDILKK